MPKRSSSSRIKSRKDNGKVDLRDFFTKKEVDDALAELAKDVDFQKELRRHGVSVSDLFRTSYPLKYLGIELSERGASRFPLADVLRIAVRPRSMDGATKGLKMSVHRKAFLERFPDVDATLSSRALFDSSKTAPLDDAAAFPSSAYAKAARPALDRLRQHTGIPVRISLAVLKKGLAAYKKGHRSGMTAHGWARARLTSFVMKSCTHYFPDHKLALSCPKKTQDFWARLDCLCGKPEQCGHYGKRTAANAKHRKR